MHGDPDLTDVFAVSLTFVERCNNVRIFFEEADFFDEQLLSMVILLKAFMHIIPISGQ